MKLTANGAREITSSVQLPDAGKVVGPGRRTQFAEPDTALDSARVV